MRPFNCFIYFISMGAIFASVSAYGQAARDNSDRPCFDVNVQIDKNNKSNTQQNCGKNYSRTSQAGQNNEATTRQNGDVNSNEVRQEGFNAQSRRPSPQERR